ncbi:MAG TPA: hypothetical protein VIF64_08405 [Pyrinomonadaceae bacterium]
MKDYLRIFSDRLRQKNIRPEMRFHPSSLIAHSSSFILHPSSFILHPSSFLVV